MNSVFNFRAYRKVCLKRLILQWRVGDVSMDAAEFEIWFAGVARLDLAQRDRVSSALSALDTEEARSVEPEMSCPTSEWVGENSIEAAGHRRSEASAR